MSVDKEALGKELTELHALIRECGPNPVWADALCKRVEKRVRAEIRRDQILEIFNSTKEAK